MSRHSAPPDAVWRALSAQVRAEEPTCWLCGERWLANVGHLDRMAFSVDHVKPVSTHPHLRYVRTNLRAAHRHCNNERGDRDPGTFVPRETTQRPITSRSW